MVGRYDASHHAGCVDVNLHWLAGGGEDGRRAIHHEAVVARLLEQIRSQNVDNSLLYP